MSDAPARVWGLVGKGRIAAVRLRCDLTLVDLKLRKTITNETQFTKTRWSPWAGQTLVGWPVRTLVGGAPRLPMANWFPTFVAPAYAVTMLAAATGPPQME